MKCTNVYVLVSIILASQAPGKKDSVLVTILDGSLRGIWVSVLRGEHKFSSTKRPPRGKNKGFLAQINKLPRGPPLTHFPGRGKGGPRGNFFI